ncbi:hypothetical protein BGZ94_007294 [Podila epigama]|nr:hypothetical protein BGZ94_007294 [Podila epigama]
MRNDGRDLDDGTSFLRNIGQGYNGQQQALSHMAGPPAHMPRMDPRLANMPPASAAMARPPLPPQPPQGILPSGVPPSAATGPSSADAISAVLGTMTPQNVYDIISSMKVLAVNEPERATSLLNANPQLSYALFQALLMMNLVDPSALQRIFPAMGVQPPAPNMSNPPPMPPQHMAPPPSMGMPPQAPGFPHVPPIPVAAPPAPVQQPHQPPMTQPTLEQQQQLLAQVMALTPADIASLPEDQRNNILQLRAKLMGGV